MSFWTLGRDVSPGHSGPMSVLRTEVQVDGEMASYLTAEQDGPAVLLLHGTYWSRVWLPVLGRLAEAGLRPLAVDFPGLGRSGGELTLETATVPGLADWVVRFVSAMKVSGPIVVAGHDIGGAVAQHLLVHDLLAVSRLVLVNSVTYDSWPAPHVARLLDSVATTGDEFLAARRQAVTTDLAGAATEERIADYLEPWTEPRVRRSWLAMAGAAHSRYTLDLVPPLRRSMTPKLLIWGEDDRFEKVEYAEKFALEIPRTTLVRIPEATHIPTENAPGQIARALVDFSVRPGTPAPGRPASRGVARGGRGPACRA
jgi:pimeloyl-ACP methyl ester carboxylesterase